MDRTGTVSASTSLLLAVVLAALVAAPAAAQEDPHQAPLWSVGYGGAWFGYSPFLEADPGRLDSDVALEDGLGAMVFVDRWLNRWIALHFDASYQRPDLVLPNEVVAVDVWAASLGFTLRPLNGLVLPAAPYLFGSAGFISYGLGGSDLLLPGGTVRYVSSETEQFLAQFGGGLDVLLFETWEENMIGLRLEATRLVPWDRPFVFAGEDPEGEQGFWRFTLGLTANVLPY